MFYLRNISPSLSLSVFLFFCQYIYMDTVMRLLPVTSLKVPCGSFLVNNYFYIHCFYQNILCCP